MRKATSWEVLSFAALIAIGCSSGSAEPAASQCQKVSLYELQESQGCVTAVAPNACPCLDERTDLQGDDLLETACVASPASGMYVTTIRPSDELRDEAWRHSSYGDASSTLSADEETKCGQVKAAFAPGDGMSAPPLCGNGSGDGLWGLYPIRLDRKCVEHQIATSEPAVVESLPNTPSSGLNWICWVGPRDDVYLGIIGSSMKITAPGWTHSAYGNGTVDSNLSVENMEKCFAAESLFGDPIWTINFATVPWCGESQEQRLLLPTEQASGRTVVRSGALKDKTPCIPPGNRPTQDIGREGNTAR